MFGDQSVGFIGGGNMGEALIRGLISASLFSAERIFAYDVIPSRIEYLEKEFGIKGRRSLGELAESSGIIVLAVKPQVISGVLDTLGPPFAQAARHIHRGWNFAFLARATPARRDPGGPRHA